ncbi:MAG: prepilin-type N-terminal cleavage/methylation domain-containing protein [Minisyncoccia bacterium]
MLNGKIKSNGGFTLVEMLAALGIFSLIITLSMGIFVSGSNSYRKTLEYLEIQRESAFILETMSREIRMAKTICDDLLTAECDVAGSDQQGNSDSDIEFMNNEGVWMKYCLADENGTCDAANGNSLGVYNGTNFYRISSKAVSIEDIKFYVNYFNTGPEQRIITIVMKLKSNSKYDTSMLAQTSVAMRVYNR